MSEEKVASGVETVAIIGAGTAGRAFALRCARAGFFVVLEDVMPSKLRRAQDEYADLEADVSGRIRYVSTVEEAVADAYIAIDFLPDELESKLEIFSLLDRMAPPRTILCTPTQALSITDLASCTYRADRCVGVQRIETEHVRIVRGRSLSTSAEITSVDFFTKLGYDTSVIIDVQEPMLVKNRIPSIEIFG